MNEQIDISVPVLEELANMPDSREKKTDTRELFTNLSGFFLEFFNGSLVDATAFVNKMSSCGRLSWIDVANDNDADVDLFLRHGDSYWLAN